MSAQITPGRTIIDATAGNGHDLLFCAKKLFAHDDTGHLFAIDIQPEAITASKEKLTAQFPHLIDTHIHFFCQSHAPLPIPPTPPSLIIYNLGYLPGTDKSITTLLESTKQSLEQALSILAVDGVISLMLYPGHAEGETEAAFLLQTLPNLPREFFKIYTYHSLFADQTPTLVLIQKRKTLESQIALS
ncbi:MAG: hypothetical protein S4CHLAM102_15530 [Chlamydiia bacterium]|nr:hypothetical protein [Chlamydiia bacterium]